MKQLGVLDSAFINLEGPNTPQHVGGLGIYDPSTAPGGKVRFKEVIANFEQRLNTMPLFRTRVVDVPGKIDRPYWVQDKNFDVEFHLRHVALPAPGDWRQLWIQAARLHARQLDMSRPLWEAYIIEGLDNIPDIPKGSFAIYTKMHHSLVDGAGGDAFMMALHDTMAKPAKETNIPAVIIADRQPSGAELFARSVINRGVGTVGLVRGTANAVVKTVKHQRAVSREEIPPSDLNAPKTRFNNPVGPHRVADAAVFDLSDFKTIKNAFEATINDVALAVVGGAMHHYLLEHNELPEESLAAGIPMNMRTRRDMTEDNNQVGSMFCDIHTNIADPVKRLRAVHQSARDAKESNEDNPMVEVLRVAGVLSPAISQRAAKLWSKHQLSKYVPANISTVISNVPGPTMPLYSAGAEMVRYHSLGLLTPGCGSFHLVFSSQGRITITFLADRDIVPDPEFYRQCIERSFTELLEAVPKSERQTSVSASSRTSKKTAPAARKKKTGAAKRVSKKTTAKNNKTAKRVTTRRKAQAKR
ncbi:MAG: wax ester/triacylglycerol synthase family O-acyltransferase [Pseudomonadales bacterium]